MARNKLAERFAPGSRSPRRRPSLKPAILDLEDRCLLSVEVPIPSTNPAVPLSTIFWNGEAQPLNPNGKQGIPAPDKVGAGKTVTLINNSNDTIFPFLRGGNYGEDPNSSTGTFYDPQDTANQEYREYVGYAKADGTKYLGLPKGASITIQVPLALWDGDNLYIASDGTNFTSAVPNIFNYDGNAKISVVVGGAVASNSVWVQASSGFPAGQTPLVMFYHQDASGSLPKTVPDDAPAQLTEITFRDPYLEQFISDDAQTFPLINYDVSYVNNLVSPVAMEASNVPITYGDSQSRVTPPTYFGSQNFGWLATNKSTAAFEKAIANFVNNAGASSIGKYFGPNSQGWPAYYNPNGTDIVIPSGSNLFDDSPLQVGGGIVHPSSFDSNRWMLTSNGSGPIAARAGGVTLTNPQATVLPLVLTPQERTLFTQNMTAMLAGKGIVDLTIAPSTTVLGTVTAYDPTDSILGIAVGNQGSGYSKANPPQVVISGGGGTGAKATAFVDDSGHVFAIGTVSGGSGYTSAPTIKIVGGGGTGATAVASIGGGRVTVQLNPGVSLPVNTPLSYVFSRPSADYAVTAITNLWYSWAQYYIQQFASYNDQTLTASVNFKEIPGKPGQTYVTNELTLAGDPPVPLAVGMSVTGPDIPDGTTILRLNGRQVYLSQVSTATASTPQSFVFGKPKALPTDANYTTPYQLTFSDAETPTAKAFAGSVYAAMSAQSVDLPTSPYLPLSMNLVAHVIKYWAKIPTYDQPWGPVLVGEVRDVVKSILRGVFDFNAVPDQTLWYPNPSKPTGGQNFNVYNLDPYVWFVHQVEQMSAYGFSVDDDVSNPTATGPRLAADGSINHSPNNLQIAFGGTAGMGNQSQWFPTIPWGTPMDTSTKPAQKPMVTIGIQPDGPYKGYSVITFVGSQALKIYNQINNPGDGQIGAYIAAPGFIVPGTTLIFKGPNGGTNPQIILSQNAISTSKPIPVTITAATFSIPRVLVRNASFDTPIQVPPQYFTVAPTGATVVWKFTGTAGIAAKGSIFTKNNPPAVGSQVAFLTNLGKISQTINLSPNRAYAVSFLVARRKRDDGSVDSPSLQVTVGQQVVGTFASGTTADGRWQIFTSNAFTVPALGPRVLTISGTNGNGDNTALIDGIVVTGQYGLASAARG